MLKIGASVGGLVFRFKLVFCFLWEVLCYDKK